MKDRIEDLAFFGGPASFTEPLHVGSPNLPDRERLTELMDGVFERRWLTNNGPLVQQLESRISDLLEVPHVIAVSNATLGLELAARALGLSGEVIVPSFTFVATAHALEWLGLEPVFCDIDPESHCLDPRRVAERITPRTSAILGVHVWGRPCAVAPLQELASRHDLRLMFDAAHAFACTHQGRWIGGFGDAEVFSFHATKFFNTLEGGAVTTNDPQVAERLRLLRNFGFAGYDEVVSVGVNAKLNEVCAAFGLCALEQLAELTARNETIYRIYRRELAALPGLRLYRHDVDERQNFQYVIGEVMPEAGLSRDLLVNVLHAERVLARRYFYPGCHRMQPYVSRSDASSHLPQTEEVCERVVSLPAGAAIGTEAVQELCQLLRFVLTNGRAIAARAAAAGGGTTRQPR